jgi:hypothetical protein
VAAEAGGSVRKRVKALKMDKGRERFPLALVPCPINLQANHADTAALIDLVRAAAAKLGCPVKLLVIDTLARAMGAGNENAPDDMGALIQNVDRLRQATGATVLLVHHSGKNQAAGARGHSSLRAATDTEIEIADGVISGTKQRDIDSSRQVPFRLRSVPVGQRRDGVAVTSAVVEIGQDPVVFPALELTPMEKMTLECLAEAIKSDGRELDGHRVATGAAWRECFIIRYTEDEKSFETVTSRRDQNTAVFRKYKSKLVKKLAVEEIKHDHWLIS